MMGAYCFRTMSRFLFYYYYLFIFLCLSLHLFANFNLPSNFWLVGTTCSCLIKHAYYLGQAFPNDVDVAYLVPLTCDREWPIHEHDVSQRHFVYFFFLILFISFSLFPFSFCLFTSSHLLLVHAYQYMGIEMTAIKSLCCFCHETAWKGLSNGQISSKTQTATPYIRITLISDSPPYLLTQTWSLSSSYCILIRNTSSKTVSCHASSKTVSSHDQAHS